MFSLEEAHAFICRSAEMGRNPVCTVCVWMCWFFKLPVCLCLSAEIVAYRT